MNERIFDLEERLVDFSSRIIDVVEALPNSRGGNYIAGQLISVGLHPLCFMVKHKVQSLETISFIK